MTGSFGPTRAAGLAQLAAFVPLAGGTMRKTETEMFRER